MIRLRQHRTGPPHWDLISIHIPKTAGTSFRNTLRAVYGKRAVARLDIELDKPQLRLNGQPYAKRQLPRSTKVIHGHFSYPLLQEKLELPSERPPIITWLRDPVARVVSNYNYLARRLAEELQEDQKNLNILPKMQRTLLEYAADPLNQNRMSKHLAGLELNDFLFIGRTEEYETGIQRLAQLLHWPQAPIFHHNPTTTSPHHPLTKSQYHNILSWNATDAALYENAATFFQKKQTA